MAHATHFGTIHDSQHFLECVLARSGYQIRLANSHAQRNKASMLVNSMYAWRGYTTDNVASLSHDPNSITLEASTEHKLFGTLTLGLDSEEGLLADELYQSEINVLRQAGCRVCELTKLAFYPEHSSKEALASLFHLAYIYGHNIYRCTDCVIEVNPRHAGFYQRRLGFREIGPQKHCARVDAPAILLHLALGYMTIKIAEHAGARDAKDKSLYPYFFSEAEMQGLTNRILKAA